MLESQFIELISKLEEILQAIYELNRDTNNPIQ